MKSDGRWKNKKLLDYHFKDSQLRWELPHVNDFLCLERQLPLGMIQDVADGFLQKALVLGFVLCVAGLQAEFLGAQGFVGR